MKCWQPDFFVFLQNTSQTIIKISYYIIMDTHNLLPARKFGPGYFIREQMEYRNLKEDDLASALKMDESNLNLLLENKLLITIEIANNLSNVFDTSVQYWLNLELNYRIS